MKRHARRSSWTRTLATWAVVLGMAVYVSPIDPVPTGILGGIGNVASSATQFLTSAVERPRNLLINATRATTGYIDTAASRGFEFKLRRFLERLRGRMHTGIPELGIPSLDPFRLDEIDIDTDNPEIGKLHLIVENLEVTKLSNFIIDRAKMSLIGPTIAINISLPEVQATGFYNISGILGDTFPLFGAGQFKTIAQGVRAYVSTVLGYARGVYLKRFDLDFSLRGISINLENFMGGDEIGDIMSKVFEELTPEAFDLMKPDILPVIQDYVAARVNETVHHLTMKDLIHILLGDYDFSDIKYLLRPLRL